MGSGHNLFSWFEPCELQCIKKRKKGKNGWTDERCDGCNEWKLIWQGKVEKGGMETDWIKLMSWVVCRIKTELGEEYFFQIEIMIEWTPQERKQEERAMLVTQRKLQKDFHEWKCKMCSDSMQQYSDTFVLFQAVILESVSASYFKSNYSSKRFSFSRTFSYKL